MASDNEASCDNDPNFAVICGFLEKFGVTCGLSDIDFLDLQEMLENTQEVSKYLVDMHVKLLRKIRKSVTPERWERSLVKLCHEFSSKDAWEIERFGYKKARLSSKLRVLKELLEMQFDYNTKFKNEINKLTAGELRCQPLGRDRNGCAYWFQTDENCQIRVYKEDIDEETWSLIAKDRNELVQLINKLSDNKSSVAASASASASDAVTNEDSTSLESDKLGTEHSSNINGIKLSKSSELNDEDDQAVDWEHQKNDPDKTDEQMEDKQQENRVEKSTKNDKQISNEDSLDYDDNTLSENGKNEKMKPLTIEIEDSNSIKSAEEFTEPQNNTDNVSSTKNQQDQTPLTIKPLINLRIKPITELLSPNHLEQITMRTVDNAANLAEFGRGPSTYVAPHALHYRKRSPSDVEDPPAEDPLMFKRTRPTLLRPKKLPNNFVGEALDEPVMYVMGEGSGNENDDSPIVGDTVEEPVMYFSGEGSGAECTMGNERREKEEDKQRTTTEGDEVDKATTTTGENVLSSKQEFKLGTIFDTKTDKPSGMRFPVKNSRWDMGRPTTVVKQCNKSENDPESTLNLCGVSDTKIVPEQVPQTTPPPVKQPIFFFGPGSLKMSPKISPIRPKLNCDSIFATDKKITSPVDSKEENESPTTKKLSDQFIDNVEESSAEESTSKMQENIDIILPSKITSKDMVDVCKTDVPVQSSCTKEVLEVEEVQKSVLIEEISEVTDDFVQRGAQGKNVGVCSDEIPVESEEKNMAAAVTDVKVPISDNFDKCTDIVEKSEDNAQLAKEVMENLTTKNVEETTEKKDNELQVEQSIEDNNENLEVPLVTDVDTSEDDSKELHIVDEDKISEDSSQISQIVQEENLKETTEESYENDEIKEHNDKESEVDIENVDDKLENEIKDVCNDGSENILNEDGVIEDDSKQHLENKEKDNDIIDHVSQKLQAEYDEKIVNNEIEESSKQDQEKITKITVKENENVADSEFIVEKETIEAEYQKIDKNEFENESQKSSKEDEHEVVSVKEDEKNDQCLDDAFAQKEDVTTEKRELKKYTKTENEEPKEDTKLEKEDMKIEKEESKEDTKIEKEESKEDMTIEKLEPKEDVKKETVSETLSLKVQENIQSGVIKSIVTTEATKIEIIVKENTSENVSKQQETMLDNELKEMTPLNLEKSLVIQNEFSGFNIDNQKITDVQLERSKQDETDLHLNKLIETEKQKDAKSETTELFKKNLDKVEQKEKKSVEKIELCEEQFVGKKEIQQQSQQKDVEIQKFIDGVELIPASRDKKLEHRTNLIKLDESQKDSKKESLSVPATRGLITTEKVTAVESLSQRSEITISKVQTSLAKTKHNSLRNIDNNEIVTITPSKKPKLSDSFELNKESKILENTETKNKTDESKINQEDDLKIISTKETDEAKKEDVIETKQTAEVLATLKDVEKEILPIDVTEEETKTKMKVQPKTDIEKNVVVTETSKETEPVVEPPCVKKSVPLLTHVDVDELDDPSDTAFRDPESLADSDSDIFEGPEEDPLMVSDNEEEEEEAEKEEDTPTPVSAPLTFNSFQLDFNDSPAPSPPPVRILTRNRKRVAEQSIDSLKETEKKEDDAKRTKLKGKRAANKDLRRIVEEQKMQPASSSEGEEGGKQQESEEKTAPKKKLGRPRKDAKSPTISSDVNSENSRTDACSTPPPNKKGRPRKKTLLGLEIPDNFTNSHEESTGSVRTSRRIAQIKIKEEAERRKLEEVALKDDKGKGKKGKKLEEDKEYRTHKKQQKKAIVPEEETTIMSVESESKKKKKKRKAGMVFSRKLYEQTNPWKYSSDDSSEEEENEEEEYEEMEPSDEEPLFKSDHEFSPESDLEADGEVQPLKRARTVKKESDVDDEIDDTNCQKCGKSDHPEWILLCDKCDNGWHCSCLRPALLVIPEGDWFCPPCQHISLVESLENKLIEYDKRLSKREMEVRRKERLAYVGISLDNVLPAKEGSEEHHHHHHKKAKKDDEGSDDDEDENGDRSGGGTSSESSGSSSDDSDEPIYQLRQRRQAQTYRFNDYDDLINSAIGEEMESVKGAGNQGRGKDIATIVNANKEEAEKRKLEMQQCDERPPVVPSKVLSKNDDDDEDDEEIVRPKPKIFKGRKKSRKLNSLDVSSEDSDSDEDFKGSSLEEEEEVDEDFDSDSSTSRKGRAALRRSTRARTARYDKDFINDESESDDEEEAPPSRKKTRSIWDESESEDSDKSWGRRKKSKRSSFKLPSHKPKKLKKKKKKKSYYDDEDCYRKKPKIKYGGLNEDEDNLTKGRRTRGKKINFLEALGTDSEEESRNRKSTRKLEESEDEYVANEEDEAGEESELEKEEEDEVEDELATKLKKKRKNVIEDSEDDSSEEEKKKQEQPQPERPRNLEESKGLAASNSKQADNFSQNLTQEKDKIVPTETTSINNDFQEEMSTNIPPINQLNLNAPPPNLLDPKHSRLENAPFVNQLNPIVAHQQQQQQLPQDLSKESDMMSWGGNQRRHFAPEDEQSSSIDEINRNFDDMNEEEMEKMMEEEEFANEQLKLVALQIEKEKQRKKREKLGGEEPKTPKKRGRKPKAALGACGGGIIGMGPSASPNLIGVPPSGALPSNIGLSSTYPTVPSMIPQSIMRGSISPSPSPYVTSEPKENEELSEPPGATIPLFSEISPMNVSSDGTPKKRRGRGKGKKTLAKEQAAAAAAAAAAVSSSSETNSSTPSVIVPGTPEQQQQQPSNAGSYPITTNPSVSTTSPILTSKLAVAAPPQPFAQSQPVPSVITRMLQQQHNNPNYPPAPGKMYGVPPAGEPPPGPNSSNGIPAASTTSPTYHYANSGPRGAPYVQPPPSASPYPVPRVGPLSSPLRLQQPQSLPPPMYHSHPMDPSPSGGGPINISGSNQQERNSSPSVLQPPVSGTPKSDQQQPSYSRHYTPGGPISSAPSMLSTPPRFVQQQQHNMPLRPPTAAPGMPPPPPFHPANYPYGGAPYAPIPPPEEAQPPEGYQGSSYAEPYGGDNNAPLTTSDNSNSRPYDEEVGGEFGGLVSYFSSQREDDLET